MRQFLRLSVLLLFSLPLLNGCVLFSSNPASQAQLQGIVSTAVTVAVLGGVPIADLKSAATQIMVVNEGSAVSVATLTMDMDELIGKSKLTPLQAMAAGVLVNSLNAALQQYLNSQPASSITQKTKLAVSEIAQDVLNAIPGVVNPILIKP